MDGPASFSTTLTGSPTTGITNYDGNLRVADLSNYSVSNAGVLVHNKPWKAYVPAPKKLDAFKDARLVRRINPVQGGGSLRERWVDSKGRIYEWDSRHGAVEMYSKRGKHLGEFDPDTGKRLKDANPSYNLPKDLLP